MKKIYVLALSLLVVSFAFAQRAEKVQKKDLNSMFKSGNHQSVQTKSVQSAFFDGFEGGFDANGWTILNEDGNANSWFMSGNFPDLGIFPYEGDSVAAVYFSQVGNDDWLISPQLTINEGEELSFYAASLSDNYLEDFEVLVSTTGTNATDFTINLETVNESPAGYVKYSYILTDNANISDGSQVYIAIRNVSILKYILLIDNFKVDMPTATVDCTPITSFPYTEDFESMTDDLVCWETFNNTAADGGLNGANLVDADNWYVMNPASAGGNGATYIHGGERAAAISYSAPDFNWTVSSDIVLPETGNYDLGFWTYFENEIDEITKFYVQVYADGVWNNELSWTDGTNNLLSEEVIISLAAYANKTIKVAFVTEYNNGFSLAIDDISIVLDPTTVSVNAIDNNSISLFPNPTTGIVNIANADNNTVVIYNMVGQVVTSVTNAQTIDMSAFENGTYIVKVISENKTITKKINLIK